MTASGSINTAVGKPRESARWWAGLVAVVGWLLLWRGTFEIVEQGTALVGLVSFAFLVAAIPITAIAATHARAAVYAIGIGGPDFTAGPLREHASRTGGSYRRASS